MVRGRQRGFQDRGGRWNQRLHGGSAFAISLSAVVPEFKPRSAHYFHYNLVITLRQVVQRAGEPCICEQLYKCSIMDFQNTNFRSYLADQKKYIFSCSIFPHESEVICHASETVITVCWAAPPSHLWLFQNRLETTNQWCRS